MDGKSIAAGKHPQSKEQNDHRSELPDRRSRADRRQVTAEESGYTGPDRRAPIDRRTGLERGRGPGHRLPEERRSAEEGEMNIAQFEFIMAIEAYKKANKRMYPTWTEILEVIHQLGYRKVEPRQVKLDNVPEAPVARVA
ncbi:MAG: hypothetical protein IT447_00060 [Phycisphaerales bacterium]|jgi:hypothetical protein|nr:hypothetical protein [Phycisphaerales bacterium]